MFAKNRERIISALDIGATKVAAGVCRLREGRTLELLGFGLVPSQGIRNGAVVDLEQLSSAIRACVAETEKSAHIQMGRALTSINSRGMSIFLKEGSLSLGHAPVPINRSHVGKCKELASNVTLPGTLQPLHDVVRRCVVDDSLDVDNPIGMVGAKLRVELLIISLPKAQITHFTKAANHAGVAVEKLVLQPLASAEAVLRPEEKDLGALFLDIGACDTSGVIFQRNKIQHCFTIPVGGDHFTRDIVTGLRTTLRDAERVKCEYGLLDNTAEDFATTIEITGAGSGRPQQVARQILAEILRPRAQDILELVKDEISQEGLDCAHLTSVVFSGGGALLNQLTDYSEKVLDIPCRLGLPAEQGEWPPELATPPFATLVGLFLWGRGISGQRENPLVAKTAVKSSQIKQYKDKVKNWFNELFDI